MSSSSKRVHFYDVNDDDPGPSHHSAGSSSSNPLESITPLPRSKSPSTSHRKPILHGVLRASSSAGLQWNTAFPPQTAVLGSKANSQEAATHPPVPSMQILFYLFSHTLTFTVNTANGHCVTVYDVLYGVFSALQQSLSAPELQRIVCRQNEHELRASFHSRCNRFADFRQADFEKKQGYKLVDMYLGQTKFAGMVSSSALRPETWTVKLS